MKKFIFLFILCFSFIAFASQTGFEQTRCNTWLYIEGGRFGENGPLPLPPTPPQTTPDSYLKVS